MITPEEADRLLSAEKRRQRLVDETLRQSHPPPRLSPWQRSKKSFPRKKTGGLRAMMQRLAPAPPKPEDPQ